MKDEFELKDVSGELIEVGDWFIRFNPYGEYRIGVRENKENCKTFIDGRSLDYENSNGFYRLTTNRIIKKIRNLSEVWPLLGEGQEKENVKRYLVENESQNAGCLGFAP